MIGSVLFSLLLSTPNLDSSTFVKPNVAIKTDSSIDQIKPKKSFANKLRLIAEGIVFCSIGTISILESKKMCFNTLSGTNTGCVDQSSDKDETIVPNTIVGAVFIGSGLMLIMSASK